MAEEKETGGAGELSRRGFILYDKNYFQRALATRAEAGEVTVLRVQERAGRATEMRVESAHFNLSHRAQLEPWEVKTLLVEPQADGRARVREVSLLER